MKNSMEQSPKKVKDRGWMGSVLIWISLCNLRVLCASIVN